MDRRHFLGALGLSAGGLAGASTRIHVGRFDAWEPSQGTWPLPRYDLRNTASNPDASPPSDPVVDWRAEPLGRVETLVVGPRRVYAAGSVSTVRTVAALERDSGERAWSTSVLTETMALRDGTLYVAGRERVTALDAETGEREWWTGSRASYGLEVLVADGTVFVAGDATGLSVLDGGTGERRWSTDEGSSPALVDGELVLTGLPTRRFASRRVSDVVTSGPPPAAWANQVGTGGPPVVVEGRVVTGTSSSGGNFGLRSFDAGTGAVQWETADALKNHHTDHYDVVLDLAILDGNVVARLDFGGVGSAEYRALVACSLADGEEVWREEFDPIITDVVVAGDLVLVGTGTFREAEATGDESRAVAGGVVAFDGGGDERWRVETDLPVRSVVPVGDTVFVGSGASGSEHPGAVSALR